MSTIVVRNLRAANLPNLDRDGSDPYVELAVGRARRRTRTVMNASAAVWAEAFTFPLASNYLNVTVWDFDGKDRPPQSLGKGTIRIDELPPGSQEVTIRLGQRDGSLTLELEMPALGGPTTTPFSPGETFTDLRAACARLWDLDENRLSFGHDFEIDVQQGVQFNSMADSAGRPLFVRVNNEVYQRPTFRALRALFDNYEADLGQEEVVTQGELREIDGFLDAIVATRPMQYCHQYLAKHNHVGPSPEAFRALLSGLWFDLYGRAGRRDSCGFEHVFCGEQRNGAVIGFHNWVKFALEEAAGRVDYRGFIFAKRNTAQSEVVDPTPNLISVKFGWEDDAGDAAAGRLPVKPISSIFIGTSPEFELALYTLCFVAGRTDNEVHVGEYTVDIKCFPIERQGRTFIGTAYPEARGWENH